MTFSNLYRGILTQTYSLCSGSDEEDCCWEGKVPGEPRIPQANEGEPLLVGRTVFPLVFQYWNALCDFFGLVWWNTRNPGDSHTMQSNWRGNPINRAMAEQQNPRPVHCLKRARSVGAWGPARCQHVWNRQLESLFGKLNTWKKSLKKILKVIVWSVLGLFEKLNTWNFF